MKAIQNILNKLNMLCAIDLSLILLKTSSGIYSIPKELNYIAVLLSINNESKCVPLPFLSLRLSIDAL